MGKRELKSQHKEIDYSVIDLLYKIDATGKLVPFLIKQLKLAVKKPKKLTSKARRISEYDSQSLVKTDNIMEEVLTNTIINNFIGIGNVGVLNRFTEHLNNKRIDNPDVTQYNDWASVVRSVTNADIKVIEKELEFSVKKVVDTDKWLMVRPLTFEASLKYGANTKWCTASRDNKSYFYSYSESGPLIYIIDKSTGLRYGVCNRPYHDGVTCWDEKDKRIDTVSMNLPADLYMVLAEELNDKPNVEYFSADELKYYDKSSEKKMVEVMEEMVEVMEDDMEPMVGGDMFIPTNGGYFTNEADVNDSNG